MYKQIKEERQAKKQGDYEIEVINDVKDILDKFQRVYGNVGKGLKPYRISKNWKESKLIKKTPEEDKKEKMQVFINNYEREGIVNEEKDMGLLLDNNN